MHGSSRVPELQLLPCTHIGQLTIVSNSVHGLRCLPGHLLHTYSHTDTHRLQNETNSLRNKGLRTPSASLTGPSCQSHSLSTVSVSVYPDPSSTELTELRARLPLPAERHTRVGHSGTEHALTKMLIHQVNKDKKLTLKSVFNTRSCVVVKNQTSDDKEASAHEVLVNKYHTIKFLYE